MAVSLQELLGWAPDIGDLAKSTRQVASNHGTSAEFYHSLAKATAWQGDGGDAARMSMVASATNHQNVAESLTLAALAMEHAHVRAESLSNKIKDILNHAEQAPAVTVNLSTNQVIPPDVSYLDHDAAAKVAAKVADVQSQINVALVEGESIDAELAKAISAATGVPDPTTRTPESPGESLAGPLKPGEVRNLGPIAGTGAHPGIPGIGAADLGEVVEDGKGHMFAIFGDSFSGDKMGAGTHYPSVAVPVTFDSEGRPHFGAPLSGPDGKNVLFPLPPGASGDTLPAGSIRMNDGTTYMMVAGTNNLMPTGGSWLTKVTDNPGAGWSALPNSWRSTTPTLPDGKPDPLYSPTTQISGFQSKTDGMVYIAADSFDRSQGVTMYRVDPEHVADRGAWQPWSGDGWGKAGDPATATLTPRGENFGELSFREVDGRPVLSGFNATAGPGAVEVYVGSGPPTDVFKGGPPTVVAHNDAGSNPTSVYQPYGGYIIPGSTLSDMNIFVSQWNTDKDANGTPYDTQQVQVNLPH